MQIACPWCSYPLAIEDDKIPPQNFLTRCPKCSGAIQVPGTENRGAAAVKHGPPPPSKPQPASPPPTPPPAPATSAPPPAASATIPNGGATRRALVALEDAQLANAMASLLSQHGYAVEPLNPPQEKLRLLHQGDFDLVVTSQTGPVLEEGKTLHKRMDHLSPDARRHTFLILFGEQFRTGDGTQAFVAAADLVAHPSGVGDVGAFLTTRLEERARVYRAFIDAEKRRDLHR